MLALGFARMADSVANSFLVVVLPLFIAELGTSNALGLSEPMLTGLILAVFGVTNAFLQPFAGRISDRARRRKIFVIGGLVGISALNLLYLLADDTLALFLIRGAQGVTVAFTVTASVALVNELSTGANRGGNMGSYNALRLTGFGAGPFVAGFVVEGGPYRLAGLQLDGFDASFLIAAAAALLSSLLVALLVRDPDRLEEQDREIEIPVLAPAGSGRRLHTIFVLGIATFVMATCIALLAPIEAGDHARRGQSGFQLAILTMSFGLGLSGGQLTAGFLVGMGYVAPFAFGSLLALAAAWLVRAEVVEARG